MNKVLLTDLKNKFQLDHYVLMIGLGFDQRCLSVINNFPQNRTKKIVGISNVGWSNSNGKNTEEFKLITNNNASIIGENAESILDVADELAKYIIISLEVPTNQLVVDITSLSHELLIILMGILAANDALSRTTLLYVGAAQYGGNSGKEDVWLSRGVKTIRSVLGFPGFMYPSKKLHLVVLAGFEVERANEVISCYEPSSLSIGKGGRDQSVSLDHFESNQLFFDKLKYFINEQNTYNQHIHHFEFSCVDPLLTKEQILDHVEKIKASSDENVVICPLNTKLSTIGVALAAIENQTIQVCYAEPEEYNVENYSTPGNEVSIISFA